MPFEQQLAQILTFEIAVQSLLLARRRGENEQALNVRYWHKADIQLSPGNVRFWG
jgi:hypothetical protein